VSDSFLAKDDPDSPLSLFPFYRLLKSRRKSLDFILTYLGRVTSISNTILLPTIFSKIKETVRRYLSNKVCFIKVNTGIKISFYLGKRLFCFCLVTNCLCTFAQFRSTFFYWNVEIVCILYAILYTFLDLSKASLASVYNSKHNSVNLLFILYVFWYVIVPMSYK
jgi:hypothetical protein